MEETTQLILERFHSLANTDVAEFRQFFRRLRKQFPEQASEACLLYIASHGVDDEAAHSMVFWFSSNASYLQVLLEEESLPVEEARKAIGIIKDIDPQLVPRFVKAATSLEFTKSILRALSIVPAIGDYTLLVPWLRQLEINSDSRVRSRSAKLLCELKPNRGLIERQMQSEDARIRANAMEALGQGNHIDEARELFRAALKDANHRVVGNALVGLYKLGETDVLNQMIQLCKHKDHLFRAAMAWALGFVKDLRAIPVLQDMTNDRSSVVRKRALNSLLVLEALEQRRSQSDAPKTAGSKPHVAPGMVADNFVE